MDQRLPDTGFDQVGGSVRAQWALTPSTRPVFSYARTKQNRGKRYDQLLGGDGNLISELNDLSLDFGSARLERLGAGRSTSPCRSPTRSTASVRSASTRVATAEHRDHRPRAGADDRSRHPGEAATQLSPRATLTAGGDVYLERLTSEAFNVNPVTAAVRPAAPRPGWATFHQGGAFVQTTLDAVPDRLRLIGAVRVGGASYGRARPTARSSTARRSGRTMRSAVEPDVPRRRGADARPSPGRSRPR